MRVITGEYKGRQLDAISGRKTRPTSDKVKEAIFNIIGPYFDADLVLDLFSGSGSLGIEAVSRGVDRAILVDKNREASQIIEKNVKSLQAEDRITVLNLSAQAALDYLDQHNEEVNLLFLDPPYDMNVHEDILEQMTDRNLLSPRALVVCEVPKRTDLADQINSLELIRQEQYGKTKIYIYQNQVDLEEEDE